MTTFQVNSPVVSELIWLELDRNLSDVYIEKRSLYGQSGGGLGTDVAVGDKLGPRTATTLLSGHTCRYTNEQGRSS